MGDRLQQRILDPFVLGAEKGFLRGRLVSTLIGLDGGRLELVQFLRLGVDLLQRRCFRKCGIACGQFRCDGLQPPFGSLVGAECLEMARLAAHDVQPRLLAARFGAKCELFGQCIECEMLLCRSALLKGAVGRQDERNAGKRRQDDSDAVCPMGDRGDSHAAMMPAAACRRFKNRSKNR